MSECNNINHTLNDFKINWYELKNASVLVSEVPYPKVNKYACPATGNQLAWPDIPYSVVDRSS